MPLTVMTAGCDEGEKAGLESLVRSAIGDRSENGSWSVSLVRIGNKLSTRLEGPGASLRGVSFIVDEEHLQEAILGVLREAGLASPIAPTDDDDDEVHGPNETQRHVQACGTCEKDFVVTYESYPGEAKRPVPVACPHCWQLNQVTVGQWAAEGDEFRAEKP